jgi:predicted ArsR family transcriptional regulator
MATALQDSRHDILHIIREKGQADVTELSKALGLSSVTVHYHVNVMQREGLLEITPVRNGVGRPRNVFTLRPEALEQFPQSYHRLSDRLLDELKSRLSDDELHHIFEKMADEIAAEHAALLQGKSLEHKIGTLIDMLGEEGFMSKLQKIGAGDFVLTQVSCPYQYVAARHPEVCELDLRLMTVALGTPVQRDTCLAHGDTVCTFHIGPNHK